jgi:addiction module RelE/StbE family toxin
MAKLIWTDHALKDLDDIGEYIAENSDKYARLTIKRLFEKTRILKKFPKTGRIVPEKNQENLRELIEGNYRIIYEIVTADRIYILTVYHSARELKL